VAALLILSLGAHVSPEVAVSGFHSQGGWIAFLFVTVGIMAIGGIFPAGTRTELQTRNQSTANYYAQQQLEQLRALHWDDAALNAGRHPAGTVCDTLGATKAWVRFYQVDLMASPLDDGLLFALLSFAPLSSRPSVIGFLKELVDRMADAARGSLAPASVLR